MRDETQLINRALELVRDRLRSGEIPAENFDMGIWFSKGHCRTVACIGGWTELLLVRAGIHSESLADGWHWGNGLHELFEPEGYASRHFSANEAADAIDRYLDGKEPWPWWAEAAA